MIQIESIEFDKNSMDLLNAYLDGGGVLIFDLFKINTKNQSGLEEAHRSVALNAFNAELKRQNENVLFINDPSPPFMYVTQKDITGEKIAADQFLGNIGETKIDQTLRHAFLEPPYGFKLNSQLYKSEIEFFNQFKKTVLKGPEANSGIYAWDTDFSNYFDPGREWWGNYFWTLEIPSEGQILSIIGSTTD